MSTFHNFAKAIQQRFEQLSQHELFVTNQDKDRLYQVYLDAFPAGTNPIFRERTEHDCSCCRQFLKNLANVVAIVDGKVETLWDVPEQFEYPYDVVANELREFTLDYPISSLFRSKERQYGKSLTIETLTDGQTIEWKHFQGIVANKHFHAEPQQPVGDYNTNVSMLVRMATELKLTAFDDALIPIENKTLYKGEEFERGVRAARALVEAYHEAEDKNTFAWANATNPACRFRNTAIGTFVTELSDGMDLETAVGRYEKMVAPTNYKRPTALITPRMIEDSLKTVDELGLRDALERRFAVLSDVSVNNVLWVDNSVAGKMKDGLASALLEAAVVDNGYDPKKVEQITIHDFMAHVVPNVHSIKALLRNVQQGNLMSLTAPVHTDAGQLFKWANDFAWSYNGNLTDSIKEKVKRAGGNTGADVQLRISLGWFNSDDLDIHIYEPNGKHIYFANKDGKQDVDMNAGYHNNPVDPVENVSYVRPQNGVYRIAVNQFSKRSTNNPGFVLELEDATGIQQFSYTKPVMNTVVCGDVEYTDGKITRVTFDKALVGGSASQTVWGMPTEQFIKVNSLMFSPNHWDEQAIGNKHWFFMLDGAHNDQPTRGIYNEYLKSELDVHRKVFEVLGNKTQCPPTPDQLSGLGFSSTKGDSLIVQVAGAKLRKTYQLQF